MARVICTPSAGTTARK